SERAALLGGTMRVTGQPHKGTVLTVRIPKTPASPRIRTPYPELLQNVPGGQPATRTSQRRGANGPLDARASRRRPKVKAPARNLQTRKIPHENTHRRRPRRRSPGH